MHRRLYTRARVHIVPTVGRHWACVDAGVYNFAGVCMYPQAKRSNCFTSKYSLSLLKLFFMEDLNPAATASPE